LGLFGKKGLSFEKLKLSDSKISSDKFVTITLNLKRKNKNLHHVAIHKLQKETVERIKESFRQIGIINPPLYAQKPAVY
jgi:hypothetical protein